MMSSMPQCGPRDLEQASHLILKLHCATISHPNACPKIEDAAITAFSSDFEGSHGGYPKTIVSLVRGEQERRSQIRQARNETIAAKSLRWSQWGTWIAAIAAVAAIIGAIASIAHH